MIRAINLHNVDLSREPPYIREAIEKGGLAKITYDRVFGGAKWFDANGPVEWRLRLMRIYSGQVSSRVQMRYNRDNPLSLGFIDDPRFRNVQDEIRWVTVAEHFGFKNAHANPEVCKLGFNEMEHRVGNVIVPKSVDIELLNEGWKCILGDFFQLGLVGQPQSFRSLAA